MQNKKKINLSNFLIFLIFSFSFMACAKSKKKTEEPPLDMVLVSAGEFVMGTDDEDKEGKAESFGIPKPWYEDEHPSRKIYLDAFYIDKYEVTNKDYKKFIDATGYISPPDWPEKKYPAERDNYPVTWISWFDAVEYARWGKKRLPLEAEWEKSARGVDQRKYPWGNNFDYRYGNYSHSMFESGDLKPVGSNPDNRSPYGVFDLSGNVWEWVADWYEAYPLNKFSSPDFGKKYRVLRGFSFYAIGHFPEDNYKEIVTYLARSSTRQEALPYTKSIDVGFRCVRSK